jgi:hypothetical protein
MKNLSVMTPNPFVEAFSRRPEPVFPPPAPRENWDLYKTLLGPKVVAAIDLNRWSTDPWYTCDVRMELPVQLENGSYTVAFTRHPHFFILLRRNGVGVTCFMDDGDYGTMQMEHARKFFRVKDIYSSPYVRNRYKRAGQEKETCVLLCRGARLNDLEASAPMCSLPFVSTLPERKK